MVVIVASGAFGEVDFSGLDALLEKYVTNEGLVDYAGLQAQQETLGRVVESLGAVDADALAAWSDADRIAYWVNVYNAFTLEVIVDHYPIVPSKVVSAVFPDNSIRQIDGAWTRFEVVAGGRRLSLDQIENEVLRGGFDEPRIHMALVCASIGCPPLRREAYRGDRLDEQLDDQARRFLADPRNFRIDRERGMVFLSSIFDWYADDFAPFAATQAINSGSDKTRGSLAFVSAYVDTADRDYLREGEFEVGYLPYDWALNDVPVRGE